MTAGNAFRMGWVIRRVVVDVGTYRDDHLVLLREVPLQPLAFVEDRLRIQKRLLGARLTRRSGRLVAAGGRSTVPRAR